MSAHTVTMRHTWEAAHRLPAHGGDGVNLHGHSWRADIDVTGPALFNGALLEADALADMVGEWIDKHLDHSAMLGALDPLAGPIGGAGCKTFLFGHFGASMWPAESHAADLDWPTVDNVAVLLCRVVNAFLEPGDATSGIYVSRVRVAETATRAAGWRA